MNHIIKISLCLCLCILSYSQNYSDKIQYNEIDEVFKSWNYTTINSIEKQISQSKIETFKYVCENRKKTLKGYWEIAEFNQVNKNSIRYEFLKKILHFKNTNDFYIIEANKSGEFVTIQNYAIYKKNKKVEIFRFEYIKDKGWQLKEKFIIKGNVEINPEKYYLEFGSGVNYNDVIITHFTNNIVDESYYYIYSTMGNFSLIFNFL